MTLQQLMSWNGNMPLQEYEALLQKIDAKKRALRRAYSSLYDAEDALDVLADEQGSEQWQKHADKRQKALARIDALKSELSALEALLSTPEA